MQAGGLDRDQLGRILAAGRGLVAELDPESVLARLLEDARELTGARYAALGILDEDKTELERFLVRGIDRETRLAIGALPRGKGILGELIRDPKPLRLRRIGEHPRSYGFPPNHPPMTSFLGVPVTVRGEVFGNLYLADKQTADEFDETDEDLLVVLAEWAAIAIDNARNYERAERRRADLERAVRGLQTTASLSREIGGESDPARVLELVAKRARALVDARSCLILLREDEEFVVAEAAGESAAQIRGQRMPVADSPAAEVMRADVPRQLRGGALGWFAVAGIDAEAVVLAPLAARGMVEGLIVAIDRLGPDPVFDEDDVLVLGSFATAAAVGIANSASLEREKLELSIAASESERRRWARDLHDETLQELGALKVMQESALKSESSEVRGAALEKAATQVEGIIATLEGLITELRPAALDELGTQAAVEALAERTRERHPLAIECDFDLAFESGREETRHTAELETTIYRVVQEALNNIVKHAGADHARIAITESNGTVTVVVEDDGRGIARTNDRTGFGLLGMSERVTLASGEMNVGPGARGGTRLSVTLPTQRSPS
ncbi:MAG TPA: GAF domain-containing sensor histidine kinase [Solirubrobacterales bacterium]